MADLFARYEFKNLLDFFQPSAVFKKSQPAEITFKDIPLAQAIEKARSAAEIFLHAQDDLLVLGLNESEAAVVLQADVHPWELA